MGSGGFFGGVAEGIQGMSKKKKDKKDDSKKSEDKHANESAKRASEGAGKLAEKASKDMPDAYRPKRTDSKRNGNGKSRD